MLRLLSKVGFREIVRWILDVFECLLRAVHGGDQTTLFWRCYATSNARFEPILTDAAFSTN